MSNSIDYKRILLKISGASFGYGKKESINFDFVKKLSKDIKSIKKMPIELGIVVGGGNIIRGRDAKHYGISQNKADKMGMIATFINAISLSTMLDKIKVKNKVLNMFDMGIYGEKYSSKKAKQYLKNKFVVIYAGGTGKVGVTNDTNSAMRAKETLCDVILKATDVDGIYDKDPEKNKNAKKFNELTYQEAIQKNLKIMDKRAFEICRSSKIPIIVFNLYKKDAIKKVILGEKVGSVVK